MALQIHPNVTYATPALAFSGLLRALINTFGAYEIVEAYDADCAGTKRRVPTGGDTFDLDNAAFAAGGNFGFHLDTPGAGDWIVLRSTNGSGLKHEIVWEFDTTTTWKFSLIPLNDLVTGGADVTPPVFPATAMGSTMGTGHTPVSFVCQAGSMQYSLWTRGDYLQVMAWDGTPANGRVIYVGRAETYLAGDNYPFVIYDSPASVYSSNGSAFWNRLSADGVTFLSSGYEQQYSVAGANVYATAGRGNSTTPSPTQYFVQPKILQFTDANNAQLLGVQDNFVSSYELPSYGTLHSLAYHIARTGSSNATWTTTWDGITAV